MIKTIYTTRKNNQEANVILENEPGRGPVMSISYTDLTTGEVKWDSEEWDNITRESVMNDTFEATERAEERVGTVKFSKPSKNVLKGAGIDYSIMD